MSYKLKQQYFTNVLPIIILLMTIVSCDQSKSKPEHILQTTTEPISNTDLDTSLSEDDRIAWQKPEVIIRMLGDLNGETVADIGAGTGYFSFRMAMKAEKVIALEIDANMVRLMEAFKVNLPSEVQNRFEARVCLPDDPLLEENEVDNIIIINTIAYIEDKVAYLETIKKGLKKGGQLMIVDFKMKNLEIDGPDITDRIPLYEVENLVQDAGYNITRSDDTTLDYQYIIIADY